MGPIMLLAGVLVALFGLASIFAGKGVASAKRGRPHSSTYGVVTTVLGVALVVTGTVLIVS